MILSNVEILSGLKAGLFTVDDLAGDDPSKPPFNTSAVDLRLANEILVPAKGPVAFDLRVPGIASFLAKNSDCHTITDKQPYTLKPNEFVLAKTIERVDFPMIPGEFCHSARVEGKSSLARCGLIVHFTAPTIHAGFNGTITLEMMNFGPMNFLLFPGMYICQLIIEQVKGIPANAPNQFKGQDTAAGIRAKDKGK